jgi:hypothetical protein
VLDGVDDSFVLRKRSKIERLSEHPERTY